MRFAAALCNPNASSKIITSDLSSSTSNSQGYALVSIALGAGIACLYMNASSVKPWRSSRFGIFAFMLCTAFQPALPGRRRESANTPARPCK
jgi:hypothetical protein